MEEIDTLSASQPEPEPPELETQPPAPAEEPVSADDFLSGDEPGVPEASTEDVRLKAVLEAIVYITEEPLSLEQISAALGEPTARIQPILDQLVEDYERPGHGLTIKEVAGGYKMATKAEHHEAVRNFVKSLKPPLKLSLAALETLAVIAYKQPVTGPEIMEIRGVQGAGVLKTLLDRKLIAAAGRKNVIGKPILYKTTKDFMVQFGLKDLGELPTLKEFEEIGRMALGDGEPAAAAEAPAQEAAPVDEREPAQPEQPEPEQAEAAPVVESEPVQPEEPQAAQPEDDVLPTPPSEPPQ